MSFVICGAVVTLMSAGSPAGQSIPGSGTQFASSFFQMSREPASWNLLLCFRAFSLVRAAGTHPEVNRSNAGLTQCCRMEHPFTAEIHTMSQQKTASPFGCLFCREALEPVPFSATDWLRAFALVRPYRCPHCFQCFFRPFVIFMKLPVVGWLLRAGLDRLGLLPRLKTKGINRSQAAVERPVEVACQK